MLREPHQVGKGDSMTELEQRNQVLEPDWQTSLKAHPFHKRVLIVSAVIVILFLVVFLQVGLLIRRNFRGRGTLLYLSMRRFQALQNLLGFTFLDGVGMPHNFLNGLLGEV